MPKAEAKVKFCYYCGSLLEPIAIGRYDKYTGEPIMTMVCSNLKCLDGCVAHGGHKWGSFWKLQGDTCQRCGHIAGGIGF